MNTFAGIAIAVAAVAVPATLDAVKPAVHLEPTTAVCTTDLDCARWALTHGVEPVDLPADAVESASRELGLS